MKAYILPCPGLHVLPTVASIVIHLPCPHPCLCLCPHHHALPICQCPRSCHVKLCHNHDGADAEMQTPTGAGDVSAKYFDYRDLYNAIERAQSKVQLRKGAMGAKATALSSSGVLLIWRWRAMHEQALTISCVNAGELLAGAVTTCLPPAVRRFHAVLPSVFGTAFSSDFFPSS